MSKMAVKSYFLASGHMVNKKINLDHHEVIFFKALVWRTRGLFLFFVDLIVQFQYVFQDGHCSVTVG